MFCIHGQLDKSSFEISKPLTGEMVMERCDVAIKSIDLQLIRVECGGAESSAREASEVQNIQIGDGDVCRNVLVPIYMIFPRLFTCPSLSTPAFKISEKTLLMAKINKFTKTRKVMFVFVCRFRIKSDSNIWGRPLGDGDIPDWLNPFILIE